MPDNSSGGLGGFLSHLNELAREMGQAINEAGNVERIPRPTASAARPIGRNAIEQSAPTFRKAQPVRAIRQSDQVGSGSAGGQMAQQGHAVRRSLGQTPEEREEQLRQMRQAHAREEELRKKKRAAYEKQQEQHKQEQKKLEAARRSKGGAPAAGAAARRYTKFLKGNQRNVQDAIALATILGSCRAESGW